MKLKDSSNSASQALTSTDAQRLVRETLRISANLASAPRRSTEALDLPVIQDPTFGGAVARQFLESSLRLICCEEIDGRRWNYFAENVGVGSRGPGQSRSSGSHQLKRSSIRAVSLQASPAPAEVTDFPLFTLLLFWLLFFMSACVISSKHNIVGMTVRWSLL